jgi:methylated-DNA-[protein]-cysteine S-methyltransferase
MKGRAYYTSPVGELLIESEEGKITTVNFLKDSKQEESYRPIIEQCILELDEYFIKDANSLM